MLAQRQRLATPGARPTPTSTSSPSIAAADPEAAAPATRRAARRRLRAGALSRLARCSRRTIRCIRGSGTTRRSTWSGRGTSIPARRRRSRRRRARQRRGVPQRRVPLQRARVRPRQRTELPRARRDRRAVCRGARPRRRRIDSSRRATSSGTTPTRSTSTATARTSPGTIGQLTNNSVGVAGMAFNVRIMPVKVIDSRLGLHLQQPVPGHRRRGGARRALCGRQRRQGDEHEHRPDRAAGARWSRRRSTYAVSRGAFVVVAAGNDFLDGNPTRAAGGRRAAHRRRWWPSPRSGGTAQRARYSNTGTYVELAAPGGDTSRGGTEAGILQQTYDFDFTETFLQGPSRYRAPRFDVFAYQFFQGTSMAAPHVSGFAALLMQQGITSPAAIEAIMKRYATDLGTRRPRQRVRVRPHQPARGAAGNGVGAMSCCQRATSRRPRRRGVAEASAIHGGQPRLRVSAAPEFRGDVLDFAASGFSRMISRLRVAASCDSCSAAATTRACSDPRIRRRRVHDLRGDRELRDDPRHGERRRVRRRRRGRAAAATSSSNVRASRFRKTGERVFVTRERRAVRPRHPDDHHGHAASSSPAGYRFDRGWRVVPYGGGGVGRHRYEEASDFADEAENVNESFTGYHVLGGAEFRVSRWLGAAGEAQWADGARCARAAIRTACRAQFDETDLGGSTRPACKCRHRT